jgi:hypothetical protein
LAAGWVDIQEQAYGSVNMGMNPGNSHKGQQAHSCIATSWWGGSLEVGIEVCQMDK